MSSTENVTNSAGSPSTERKPRYKNIMHLWEFLLELLADKSCRSLITWTRKAHGEFKFKKPEEVAARWGLLKHRPRMNYGKLSRALRYYYNTGIIKKVPGQRLVYRFHKLPYEYALDKPRSGSQLIPEQTSTASSTRPDENRSKKTPSLCSKGSLDKPERPIIDKERFLQERLARNRSAYTEQAEQMPFPTASPEFSTAPYRPKVQPIVPIPIRLPVRTCTQSELGMVEEPAFCCTSLFPVSVHKQLGPIWSCEPSNGVLVSVITRSSVNRYRP